MIDLNGKVALVTGASRGIGAATALRLAEAGASLVVNYFNHEAEAARVTASARSFRARAIAVRADISRADDVRTMFEQALAEFDRLDIVIANAGVWTGAAVDRLDEQSWQETIDVNLKGVFLCCHFAAKIMKHQRSGRIVTLSSTAGQRGEAFHSHYAASKGGIISFTKSLAAELGSYGITVNSVAPGWVDTDMSAEPLRDPPELEKINRGIPLGRVACADDVAGPILFLASDLARHITGEVINVNGGSVMCG
ncbi:MAG TPA: SDR family NAD(P)-dependent oxidoreductase [Blastocatellia bacterium]|nr:SDR family NAD(P)-dependent oxidoreductase [Blastocatellia bacterium]